MGAATDRPYGQDGGVVQLPLALDSILAGQSPYGADYSSTILARQARVSSFWDELRRQPDPPPPRVPARDAPGDAAVPPRVAGGPRLLRPAHRDAPLLRARRSCSRRACLRGPTPGSPPRASAALNPLVYWPQIFGANDVVFVAMILGVVLLLRSDRRIAAGTLLGLACATKQLAWPFAPFLILAASGARALGDLRGLAPWRRMAGPAAAAAAVFVAVVAPVAALDFDAFWSDIVAYNVGLPGADNYPLGGTPGFGFANFLIYAGRVASLKDYFPFSVFYLLLVPLGLLLARAQVRFPRVEWALVTGSAALLASVYFSRVVHPNYLAAAAILLPVAVIASGRHAVLALAPLLLLATAVETVENGIFRTVWEQASAAGYPARRGRARRRARSAGGAPPHPRPARAALRRDRRRRRPRLPGRAGLRRRPPHAPPRSGRSVLPDRGRPHRGAHRGGRPHRSHPCAGPVGGAGAGRRAAAPFRPQPAHPAPAGSADRARGGVLQLPPRPSGGDPA